tara:strand:- start:79901 stop:80362 length:462 start_codon:yes stop_codon:yes gene_type:complete
MKNLLIISNIPSPNMLELIENVKNGAESIYSDKIKVTISDAREINHEDILESSAIILGTTENLGYMSGIMKDFFDRNYNACLDKTNGMPYAIYIRAGHDGTGTEINIKKIITGLKWKEIQKPLILKGSWNDSFKEECFNLGATVAAGLDAEIY